MRVGIKQHQCLRITGNSRGCIAWWEPGISMLPTIPPKSWSTELQYSYCSHFSSNNRIETSHLNLPFTCWLKISLISFSLKSEPRRNISNHFTSPCSVPVDDLQTLSIRKCSSPGYNLVLSSFLFLLCFSRFEISTLWRDLNFRNHCIKWKITGVLYIPPSNSLLENTLAVFCCADVVVWGMMSAITSQKYKWEWSRGARCEAVLSRERRTALPEINPLWDVCCWDVLIWTSELWHGEGTLLNKPGVSTGPSRCHWFPVAHSWDKWPARLLGMVLKVFNLYIL